MSSSCRIPAGRPAAASCLATGRVRVTGILLIFTRDFAELFPDLGRKHHFAEPNAGISDRQELCQLAIGLNYGDGPANALRALLPPDILNQDLQFVSEFCLAGTGGMGRDLQRDGEKLLAIGFGLAPNRALSCSAVAISISVKSCVLLLYLLFIVNSLRFVGPFLAQSEHFFAGQKE